MELAMELLVSAFIAIALSFLIAKLVSAILAPDSDGGRGSEAEIAGKKRIVMEELRLRSAQGGESGSRVEAVQGEVREVDRFGGQAPETDSVEVGGLRDESDAVDLSVEPSSLVEVSSSGVLEREVDLVKELNDCDDQEIEVHSMTREFDVAERGEIGSSSCEEENQRSGGGGNEEIGVVCCEEEDQRNGGDGDEEIGVTGCEEEDRKSGGNDEIRVVRCEEGDRKSGGSEEIGVVRCEDENQKSGGSGDIGVVRCEESLDEGRHGVEEEVRVDGDDDDWEGIERSELEKVFAAAANYVASGDHGDELGGVGSDVEMELYGLHKVATEGPCRESQPMALRVSARANWNAWQRLGNMNPDVAMERYVALLSEKIPGWSKDNHAGDSKRDVFQEGTTSTQDTKLSTFPRHEPSLTDERKPEPDSAVEGDHLTETSHVVEKVKE